MATPQMSRLQPHLRCCCTMSATSHIRNPLISPCPKLVTSSVIFGRFAAVTTWEGEYKWFVSFPLDRTHMRSFFRRSHATTPVLPPPTPLTFPLDFQQLLQATTASPTRLRPIKSSKRHGKRRESTIVEEEEGWDLMNDVAS